MRVPAIRSPSKPAHVPYPHGSVALADGYPYTSDSAVD
jgi:hypothetical protein